MLPRHLFILFVLIMISFVQHKDHLNKEIQGIHSWRQSQTMWNIRNFARHDNNILNPRTNCFNPGNDNLLRYEFPLMQWLLAKPYMKSDENIASVRISLFILGAVTIFGFSMLCSYVIGTPIVATCTSSGIPPRKYPMASRP